MKEQIKPHGGELVNRILTGVEREEWIQKAPSLPSITLNERTLSDVDMIACGALSPLTGFMGSKDYKSVVETMRLANGVVWSLPITIAVTKEEAAKFGEGKPAALYDEKKNLIAILNVEEKYSYSKDDECQKVYRTTDSAHPGVAYVQAQGDMYLGGTLSVLNRVKYDDFNEHRKDPSDLRKIFQEKKMENGCWFPNP